jgi:hypothetical protein
MLKCLGPRRGYCIHRRWCEPMESAHAEVERPEAIPHSPRSGRHAILGRPDRWRVWSWHISHVSPAGLCPLTGTKADNPLLAFACEQFPKHLMCDVWAVPRNKNIVPSYDSELVRLSILDATRSCSSRLSRTPKQIASGAVRISLVVSVALSVLHQIAQQIRSHR